MSEISIPTKGAGEEQESFGQVPSSALLGSYNSLEKHFQPPTKEILPTGSLGPPSFYSANTQQPGVIQDTGGSPGLVRDIKQGPLLLLYLFWAQDG